MLSVRLEMVEEEAAWAILQQVAYHQQKRREGIYKSSPRDFLEFLGFLF